MTVMQVADEHAGKPVRCPTCQKVLAAPAPPATAMAETALSPPAKVEEPPPEDGLFISITNPICEYTSLSICTR